MLVVHVPFTRVGVLNASPFCAKLETYLRLAGIPYEAKAANPMKAPKGKVPYVLDGELVLSDSQHIVEHLKRTRGDTLDGWLSPDAVALGHVVRRALEEGTYFAIVYARWIDPAGWEAYKPIMNRAVPSLVLPFIRRKVGQTLHAQGTGRHKPEEIYAMAADDLAAVSQVLGDQPYLLGDQPSSFDATAFAMIESIRAFEAPSALRDAVLGDTRLLAYADRVRERCWAEESGY